jgi:hypothetical protein
VLVEARAELQALPENPWKAKKLAALDEVLVACAGLFLEASAADFAVVPGGELQVTAIALNRSPAALALKEIRLPGGVSVPVGKPLTMEAPAQIEKAIAVPVDAAISNPYWLAEPPERGLYRVTEPSFIGLPEQPPALLAEFVLDLGGRTIAIARPIIYKWTDQVAGERYRSIEITPPVTVNPGASVLVFPDQRPRELAVTLKAARAGAQGTLKLAAPAAYVVEPASIEFKLEHKGDEAELEFHIRGGASPGGALDVVATVDGKSWSRSVVRIDHGHIPIQTLFPPATVKLVHVDLKTGGKKIGYVAGAGDEVPAALRQVGYDVTLLSDEQLASRPLNHFDALVTGVRAFNTRPRLAYVHGRLMDYVKSGGTLLVQYNTNNRLAKLSADIGPWPFEISQDRVTDEKAAVEMSPKSAVLLAPNKIGAADYDDWIQERGLYFAGKWDERYETPLTMHDPGENAKKGALLVGKYGKGRFVYTGLAFFRQLPAGVPGAFRLFANLLAHPK